jgi:mRNA-degrading endonuclease HigB of HigAB toxin-antitoxin module
VRELELAVSAKDREMELLEDNHRVELRVYQQKVKHLEYEQRNELKSIQKEGASLLEDEQQIHEDRERELLRSKEDKKFEQMQAELLNATRIAEVRQRHEKELTKFEQQFQDGLTELTSRCEGRLQQLQMDLELRRRVEIHEVEERKNQHINDLVKNHDKAYAQMKEYYNDITRGNLKLIKDLQKKVEELKERAVNNKRLLTEYKEENQTLSKPLTELTNDISRVQDELRERTKDQMALRNANSRLRAVGKNVSNLRAKLQLLEEEYTQVEREKDMLYNNFEESIHRIQQQAEFHNQALEQRLRAAESNAEKAALQVEEIIRAANLDAGEMARVISSLNQMLAAKDDALQDVRFLALRLKKAYNDSLDTFTAKLKELGIPSDEINDLGFNPEPLPSGVTSGPAGLVY